MRGGIRGPAIQKISSDETKERGGYGEVESCFVDGMIWSFGIARRRSEVQLIFKWTKDQGANDLTDNHGRLYEAGIRFAEVITGVEDLVHALGEHEYCAEGERGPKREG